jgi:hypothetical protein
VQSDSGVPGRVGRATVATAFIGRQALLDPVDPRHAGLELLDGQRGQQVFSVSPWNLSYSVPKSGRTSGTARRGRPACAVELVVQVTAAVGQLAPGPRQFGQVAGIARAVIVDPLRGPDR